MSGEQRPVRTVLFCCARRDDDGVVVFEKKASTSGFVISPRKTVGGFMCADPAKRTSISESLDAPASRGATSERDGPVGDNERLAAVRAERVREPRRDKRAGVGPRERFLERGHDEQRTRPPQFPEDRRCWIVGSPGLALGAAPTINRGGRFGRTCV